VRSVGNRFGLEVEKERVDFLNTLSYYNKDKELFFHPDNEGIKDLRSSFSEK